MDSPCIRICVIKDGLCTGCFRSLKEIANWSQYTESERDQIMKELPDRAISETAEERS